MGTAEQVMRIPTSLRDFFDLLTLEGQCVTWPKRVALEPDIREIAAAAVKDRQRGPAVIFDQIDGYPGGRIAVNVHGSIANLAMVLGLSPETSTRGLFHEFVSRWTSDKGKLEWVDAASAPVFSQRLEGDINLYELLPLFRINSLDGGFYIAKAATVSHDPHEPDHFGKQNVGTYRIQVHEPNRVTIVTAPSHDLGRQIAAAEQDGLELNVAIMIGPHPAVALFSGTPLPYDENEYAYAAGSLGAPLRLTKTANGLDVLADCEMVIEARLLNGERRTEGPFGEYTGAYSPPSRVPLFEVTRVFSRPDPIFENICLSRGWAEIDTLLGMNTCVPMYMDLVRDFPEVQAVNALYQHGLTVVISVRNRYGGFAKSVAMRALGSAHGLLYAKNVILVDEDVDPFDLEEVVWSLSTRTRRDDIMVLPDMPVNALDPSALVPGKGHRLIVDATLAVSPDKPFRSNLIESQSIDAVAEASAALDSLRRADQGRGAL